MPIYEYQCDDCNHVLDALQKVSDKPLVDCPECGKTSLRRLISAPNFRLKGEGWYETDFKNKDSKTKKQTEGGEDKKSTKSDKKEKKTSSKVETAKTSKSETAK